tara:strand:- start:1626 stop:1997 length:372 start_codon:yes stop_codon:yes gene_type:complete
MKIDKQIIMRTKRSIKCLSFNSSFYQDIQDFGMKAETVFKSREKYLTSKANWFLSVSSIERDFQWLISIGILRREVDGQGLTSKVRLTPLGREILKHRPELPEQKPFILELLINCLFRKLILK